LIGLIVGIGPLGPESWTRRCSCARPPDLQRESCEWPPDRSPLHSERTKIRRTRSALRNVLWSSIRADWFARPSITPEDRTAAVAASVPAVESRSQRERASSRSCDKKARSGEYAVSKCYSSTNPKRSAWFRKRHVGRCKVSAYPPSPRCRRDSTAVAETKPSGAVGHSCRGDRGRMGASGPLALGTVCRAPPIAVPAHFRDRGDDAPRAASHYVALQRKSFCVNLRFTDRQTCRLGQPSQYASAPTIYSGRNPSRQRYQGLKRKHIALTPPRPSGTSELASPEVTHLASRHHDWQMPSLLRQVDVLVGNLVSSGPQRPVESNHSVQKLNGPTAPQILPATAFQCSIYAACGFRVQACQRSCSSVFRMICGSRFAMGAGLIIYVTLHAAAR
jgi:hypothetical protein